MSPTDRFERKLMSLQLGTMYILVGIYSLVGPNGTLFHRLLSQTNDAAAIGWMHLVVGVLTLWSGCVPCRPFRHWMLFVSAVLALILGLKFFSIGQMPGMTTMVMFMGIFAMIAFWQDVRIGRDFRNRARATGTYDVRKHGLGQ